jgi:hypothetical protein
MCVESAAQASVTPEFLVTKRDSNKQVNQHFIPRFIIEGFVDHVATGNRGVWVYRATTQSWAKRPTRRIASLEDFYSFVEANGDRDDTLEHYMQEIETQIAPFFRNGIEKRRRLNVPREDDAFVTFCALLICRNPTTVERTKRALEALAYTTLHEAFSTPQSFQDLRRRFREKTGKEFPNFVNPLEVLSKFRPSATHAAGLGFSILNLAFLCHVLGNSQATFLCAPANSPFITSDVPYYMGFSRAGEIAEILVPLSARTSVVFHPNQEPRYQYLNLTATEVEIEREQMLRVARGFIISPSTEVFTSLQLAQWSRKRHAATTAVSRPAGA